MSDTLTSSEAPTDLDETLTPPPPGSEMQGIFQKAAQHTRRTAIKPGSAYDVPQLTDIAEAEALAPGAKFIDPDGVQRIKPYEVKAEADLANVPEGSHFVDPNGTVRLKPQYEGIGLTAQYAHDLALTKEGRRQALEKSYPGQVFPVDDKGEQFHVVEETPEGKKTYRRAGAGRGVPEFLGATAAVTPQVVGATVFGALGAAGGTAAAPGPGTATGAFTGMVGGAMLGQAANNAILGLMGIHENLPDQVKAIGWEGAGAAGGEVLGRAVSAVPGLVSAARKGAEDLGAAAKSKLGGLRENMSDAFEAVGITPERARGLLGTTPEIAERSARIATTAQDLGIKQHVVPPSIFAPEAPRLHKLEEFDAAFRKQNVFGQGAQQYYDLSGAKVLQHPEIGVALEEPLTQATKKVSAQEAGRMSLDRARFIMAQSDSAIENAKRDAQAAFEARRTGEVADYETRMATLVDAQKTSRAAADDLVEQGMKSLRTEVDQVLKLVKADENPGDAFRQAGDLFKAYNTAVRTRAKELYNNSYAAGGDFRFPTNELGDTAAAFLRKIPETVRQKYPEDIARIKRLAGEFDEEGALVKAAEPLNLSELHQLRSWLRYGVDWNDLTPDMRAGSLKFFEQKVNGLLHSSKLPDEIKPAIQMLDEADAYYKKNIPFLNDSMVTTVMDGLRAGVPPNPGVLADLLFDPTRTEAMRAARKILGEPFWKTVEAAHLNNTIRKSMTLEDGMLDAKTFASQVEDMVQSGILETGYSKETATRVRQLAADLSKLEGNLPVRVEAGDTMSTLLRRAKDAELAVQKEVEADPIKALGEEARRIEKQFQTAFQTARDQRRADPLNFLFEDSMSHRAVTAANRILGDQDRIMAAAQLFERESPEFKALQRVYAHRFFQRALGQTGKMRAELAAEKGAFAMTEEVQALMFPGVTRNTMLELVKDMEFLFSRSADDFGGSLAAAGRVLNPWQHIPLPKMGGVSGTILKVPGANFVGAYVLGKTFATLIDGISHPNFLNWLAGNLRKGGAERQEARRVLQERMRLGGWLGAGAGMALTNEDSE